MISSDYFSIERGLSLVYYGIAAPFVNLCAYLFIGFLIGYEYALITLGF